MLNGSCLCGALRFEVSGTPGEISACHCGQCRKQSGGVWTSAQVHEDELSITGDVQWYVSSASAKRGSCPECGSFLFWKANEKDRISFALGAIDGSTGLKLEKHIFVADKGDYYTIADGLPQER